MKNKKIILIIVIVLALALIGGGIIYTIGTNVSEKEESTQKQEETNKNGKVNELKSIITPDKKIRFGTTSVYRLNGVSGITVNVVPYEDFDKVYLKMTMNYKKEKEIVILYLENLRRSEQIEHEIQSANDWSKVKSWSIEIVTEEEAKRIKESQK